ncbi:MAG: hypothetical protein U0232_10015 [Thermomicrobiales bacterium]
MFWLIVLADQPQAPSQAIIAIAIALPILVPGATLAFIVARFSAWYARRWRMRDDR